jgi:hypothetical protein
VLKLYKNINIYGTKLISLERSLNLFFIINLFRDTNVVRIFYKSSQTYGTETKSDSSLGTEGAVGKLSLVLYMGKNTLDKHIDISYFYLLQTRSK